ncbi:MAG: succinylglutamate desuccinylase/aspartoacylase family protein [Cyclobacteriaceae bacterium]|nr:succinylglutamate desuccinylase/aspartoacylase family protein [Cyclobacteriaceae bacterium]
MERLLGKIEGEMPGPLVICVAALHGNEQVGLHAFRNVYSAIKNHQIKFSGKLVGLAGNLKAIESNRRYIDYDLNRVWDDQSIAALLDPEKPPQAEDEEFLELRSMIEAESQGDYSLKVLADLHATSSDKGNFIVVPEGESGHPVIQSIRLPVVVDLDKYLRGTLLAHYYTRGFVSFAFEGGIIGTGDVYQLHTSGLWEILDKAGSIRHHDHEQEDHYARLLEEVSASLPTRVKAIYRHRIRVGDGFKMLPGFHNFQPVYKGQQLALDHNGALVSPHDGLVFMPLYQPEGEDGFFIVKEMGREEG